MAARTLVGTGELLASVSANWDGSAALADGDSITIVTNQKLVWNIDTSAWTGIGNMVINSHATVPGELIFKAGTSGYLKQRTGSTIAGTNAAVKGRIVANNSGIYGETVALPFADKAIILIEGTSYIDATYLDIKQYPTEPINPYVRTYGTRYTVTVAGNVFSGATLSNTTPVMIRSSGTLPAPLTANTQYYVVGTSGSTCKLAMVSGGTEITLTNTGSGTIELYTGAGSGITEINVFEDVTADTAWTNAAGHDHVVLVNISPQAYDQQRTTIASIAASAITLADATDSVQYPGARIILASRNVSNLHSGTGASTPIVSMCTGGVFGELRKTAGTGTTFYGYGLSGCTSCTGNPIACVNGFSTCTACTGNPAVGSNGFSSCLACTGNPAGFTSGFTNSSNCTGNPVGCTQGFNICTNCTGNVAGCSTGFSSCTNCTGNPSACVNGFSMCVNCVGNSTGCTADVFFSSFSTLKTRNKLGVNTWTGRNVANKQGRITSENYLGVVDAHKVNDMFGDITKVTCGAGSPVPATGPGGVAGDCLEASSIQTTCGTYFGFDVIQNVPLKVSAGTHTVTFKTINSFSGGIQAAKLKLCIEYTASDGTYQSAITDSGALTTATDWSQVITSAPFTCLAGWIRITLTLWQYDGTTPLLYVWPIPVVT